MGTTGFNLMDTTGFNLMGTTGFRSERNQVSSKPNDWKA